MSARAARFGLEGRNAAPRCPGCRCARWRLRRQSLARRATSRSGSSLTAGPTPPAARVRCGLGWRRAPCDTPPAAEPRCQLPGSGPGTPVQPLAGSVKHRAGLVGLVAHGDDRIESLIEVAVQRFAFLGRDVDAQLRHGADRQRPNLRCLGARRMDLESIAAQGSQQAFGHLTAGRIMGAQKQNPDRLRLVNHRQLQLQPRCAGRRLRSHWSAAARMATAREVRPVPRLLQDTAPR